MSDSSTKRSDLDEDSSDVSQIWKRKAEDLARSVSAIVDYNDGMIITIHQ